MVTVEQGILILNQRRYRGRHNTTGNRLLRNLPCSCIGHLHIPVPQDLRGPQPYYSNLPGGDTFKGDIVCCSWNIHGPDDDTGRAEDVSY